MKVSVRLREMASTRLTETPLLAICIRTEKDTINLAFALSHYWQALPVTGPLEGAGHLGGSRAPSMMS